MNQTRGNEEATLIVSGIDGADIVNHVPPLTGKNGAALGPDGNGADGTSEWWHCKEPAGIGQPGNHGYNGPPGDSGGNGRDVEGLRISCGQYVGPPITLVNQGGNGGRGGDGGLGGDGSDGGNAGKQPKYCDGVVEGGIGGDGGRGGRAGKGGNAGNAGDVKIVLGPGLDAPPINVVSAAGTPGKQGEPGGPGVPGKGGENSDGTCANDGVNHGGGPLAQPGKGGYGGSSSVGSDPKAPPGSLQITIAPRPHG